MNFRHAAHVSIGSGSSSCRLGVTLSGPANLRASQRPLCRKRTARHGISRAVPAHAAVASATVVASSSSLFTPHNAASIANLLTSAGIFTVCVAAAAFLVACIPGLWAMARVAMRAESVLKIVEQELPDSAALLRLSGIEVTDCMSELSSLGSDLSTGLRSAATLATMTEKGVRQSMEGAGRVINDSLVPMAARTEQATRSMLEAELQQRAQLKHTQEMIQGVRKAAGATAGAVRRARVGLQLAQLVGAAVNAGGALRRRIDAAAVSNLARSAQTGKVH